MDIDKARRFAELKRLIAAKDADIKVLKEELEPLEAELLDEFAEEGVASVGVKDGDRKVTVFSKRMLVATNLVDPEATAQACKAAGLGHMVGERVNANTLSAYVRDLEKADEPLPDSFEGVIGTFEKFSVGVRSS